MRLTTYSIYACDQTPDIALLAPPIGLRPASQRTNLCFGGLKLNEVFLGVVGIPFQSLWEKLYTVHTKTNCNFLGRRGRASMIHGDAEAFFWRDTRGIYM